MKTIKLATLVIALSFGCALGSTLINLPTYVWGRSVQNPTPHCIYVGDKCNDIPPYVCQVIIPIFPSGSVIARGYKDFPQCTILMYDNQFVPLFGEPTEFITQIVEK